MAKLSLLIHDPAAAFFVVVLMVFAVGLGLLALLRPDITWWFETALRSWQYDEDPEPSDGALLMQRVGGATLILGVLFFAWKIWFSGV